MNRDTGGSIDTLAHINQSLADLLSTRIGTRVMRREYGSLLPDLVDHPFNDATRLRTYAATIMAILQWEPRISISRVQFLGASLSGRAEIQIEGCLVDSNEPLNLKVPLQLGGSA